MAVSRILVALAMLAIVALKTYAMEYVVGGADGWKLGVNYTIWAQDKQFWVGDKLIFKYTVGAHNVLKVDGASFKQCTAPAGTVALTSGEDVITLATPGRKWYICSIGNHCEAGPMKLFVNVMSQVESPAPAPGPTVGSASGVAISKFYALMVGVFGVVMIMMA